MKYIGSFIILLLLLNGCSSESDVRPNTDTTNLDPWLVPKEDIIHFDAEKDKIISLDSNSFIPISSGSIHDDELVFAYHYNGITRVYPISIMGGHEISNDWLDDHYYAVTYCPITGSALAWNREIDGKATQFGVSGKLYKNNLIPYDRNTGSHWSQMKSICINGDLMGDEPGPELLIETRFSTIVSAYPDAELIFHTTCDSGICRLKQSDELGDPNEDPLELPPDARYYGIVKDQTLVLFELNLFADSISLFQTRFRNMNLVVAGSRELHFFVAFKYVPESTDHRFYPVQNSLPVIMRDSQGNNYDMFGNIVKGPSAGNRLNSPTSYVANTFAWQELFNEISIFQP